MTNIERRDKNLPYKSDEAVFEQQKKARRLTQQLNTIDRSDFDRIKKIISELFGKCGSAMVNPPFYCDYGFNIEVGENFFCNYNCTILDVAKVKIGDNCFFAPNVALYTAGHALYPNTRVDGWEYGKPITIGNNVWLGGNVIVLPGITIGDNVVVGAGSVVTKDIPSWSLACGNPCKVVRKITEEDKKYIFKNELYDEEAWSEINYGSIK